MLAEQLLEGRVCLVLHEIFLFFCVLPEIIWGCILKARDQSSVIDGICSHLVNRCSVKQLILVCVMRLY